MLLLISVILVITSIIINPVYSFNKVAAYDTKSATTAKFVSNLMIKGDKLNFWGLSDLA